MRRATRYAAIFTFFLACRIYAPAQIPDITKYDFTPREKIIFADDFRQDTLGKFPSKWHRTQCYHDEYETNFNYHQYWKILRTDTARALGVYTTFMSIAPNMDRKNYLTDSFTVEFDYKLDSISCVELGFRIADSTDTCKALNLIICSSCDFRRPAGVANGDIFLPNFHSMFNAKEWHHFALSYISGLLKVFIDKYWVSSIEGSHFSPYAISLGCIAPVQYAHFKITTGKEINPFNRLLTESTFVTHAINFDVNKSRIKPESMAFITKLANFLKANPAVKLEIDGHTDSDGNANANLALSQARADEVKKQLIAMGVDSSRLIAKGFGDTKPIKPNTTPEGKAENRRVEFIRL